MIKFLDGVKRNKAKEIGNLTERIMINLVIDSCIYRQDPNRKGVGFRSIEQLASKRHLKLHVPFFVFKEIQTNQYEDQANAIDTLIKDASRLSKKIDSQEIQQDFAKADAAFQIILEKSTAFIEEYFKSWIQKINGEILPIAVDHGERVADSYFKGSKPFKSIKNRNDLPDGFIFESIVDLARKFEGLIVVTSDKTMKSSCEALGNTIVFESLTTLIQSEPCFSLLREHAFEEELEDIKARFHEHEAEVKNKLNEELLNFLPNYEFEDSSIPSESNDATVESIGDIDEFKIEYEDIEYLGSGNLIVDFECSLYITAHYYIHKGDFYALSDERTEFISTTESSDHYFEAEEEYLVDVTGRISMSFDLSVVPEGVYAENLGKLVQSMNMKIETIDDFALQTSE